ncbi:MAG: A24 family peptidase [Gammaproteobacteria bacterium]
MQIVEILQQQPILLLIVVGVMGALVGSFLNVVIYRLPLMLQRDWQQQCTLFQAQAQDIMSRLQTLPERYNLFLPGSTCSHCQQPIKPWDNLPILSYLLLRGKCRHCQENITWRYPAIELFAVLLSLMVAWQFGWDGSMLAALFFTWLLLAMSVIDIDEQILPDHLTLSLLWLGLLLSVFDVFIPSTTAILGAAAGYLTLWLVAAVFKLITGKDGMGHGDFKLLAALGAWLGWQLLPLVVIVSSLLGLVVGVSSLLIKRQQLSTAIPFGPYLAVAGWISLLWGPDILSWYLHLAGLN